MALYAVDVNRVVVMFVKVNVKTAVVGCNGGRIVEVVTTTLGIRFTAGASPGRRITKATRTTQAATTVLAMTGLLKSLPSRSSV